MPTKCRDTWLFTLWLNLKSFPPGRGMTSTKKNTAPAKVKYSRRLVLLRTHSYLGQCGVFFVLWLTSTGELNIVTPEGFKIQQASGSSPAPGVICTQTVAHRRGHFIILTPMSCGGHTRTLFLHFHDTSDLSNPSRISETSKIPIHSNAKIAPYSHSHILI